MYLKGRVSILDMFDRPFRELHELYKIVYDKAEAQAKADAEKAKQEEEKKIQEQNAERARRGLPPLLRRGEPLPDAKPNDTIAMPSFDSDDLEEAMEMMAEGGAV